jgi:uncharacterized protein
MLKQLAISALLLFSVIVFNTDASTPEPPAVPQDYVIDLANIVGRDISAQLNTSLQTLEQTTTAQILVLTIQSLDGQSIEEFAFNTKEKWKLGQKGKDNGVLLVVAVKDRKYRIEVGYGLESVLPDSLVGSIGREYLVPYFRKGEYGTGIYNAMQTIISIVSINNDGIIFDVSKYQHFNSNNEELWSNIKGVFLFFILPIALLIYILRRCPVETIKTKRKKLRRSWTFDGYGGYGIGGFGGGGYGGGSFGGGGGGGFGGGSFGGGGGGTGGGGGASGGW